MFNKKEREVYSGKSIIDVYIFVTHGEERFVESKENLGINLQYSIFLRHIRKTQSFLSKEVFVRYCDFIVSVHLRLVNVRLDAAQEKKRI